MKINEKAEAWADSFIRIRAEHNTKTSEQERDIMVFVFTQAYLQGKHDAMMERLDKELENGK